MLYIPFLHLGSNTISDYSIGSIHFIPLNILVYSMLTFDVCTKPLIFFSLVIHSGPKHKFTLFHIIIRNQIILAVNFQFIV